MENRRTIRMQFLMIFYRCRKYIINTLLLFFFPVKYGKAMVELCSEIERNIGKFKVPPIGPLGKYIKLTKNTGKNENIASLVQHMIGFKLLRAFLVDNKDDRIKVEYLMKKVNFGKMPTIETKKRYDNS